MIIRRLVLAIVGLAVMAASAGVVVVAASFALYTFLEAILGPPLAAAVIAAGFAVVLGVAAVVTLSLARGKRKASAPPVQTSLGGRGFEVLRDRPLMAAGAAVAAGLIAWRNPALVAILLRTLDPGPDGGRARR